MMVFSKKTTVFVACLFLTYYAIAQTFSSVGTLNFPSKKIYLPNGYSSMGAENHSIFYRLSYNSNASFGGIEIVYLNIAFHGNSNTRYCFNRPNGSSDCYPRTDGMGIGRLMDIHMPSFPTLEYIDFTYDIYYNGRFLRTTSDSYYGRIDAESPNIKLQINIPNNEVKKDVKLEEVLNRIKIDNVSVRAHTFAPNVIQYLNKLVETDYEMIQEAEKQARVERKKKEEEQRKAELAKEEQRKKEELEKQKAEQLKKEEAEKQKTELAKKETNEKLLKEKGNGVAATSNMSDSGDKKSTSGTSGGSSSSAEKTSASKADSINHAKSSYSGPPIPLRGVDGTSSNNQTPTQTPSKPDVRKQVADLNTRTQAKIEATNTAISTVSDAITNQMERAREEREAKEAYAEKKRDEVRSNLKQELEKQEEADRKKIDRDAAIRERQLSEWNNSDLKQRADAYREIENNTARFSAWVNACELGTSEALQKYIDRYQNDYFSKIAVIMIDAWKNGSKSPNNYIKLAIKENNWPLADYLLDSGANPNYFEESPLNKHFSPIRQFLEADTEVGLKLQYKDDKKMAFLKKLILMGADPNALYNESIIINKSNRERLTAPLKEPKKGEIDYGYYSKVGERQEGGICSSYVIRLILLNDYKGEILKWLLDNHKLNQASIDDGFAFLLDQRTKFTDKGTPPRYLINYDDYFKKYNMFSFSDNPNSGKGEVKLLDR